MSEMTPHTTAKRIRWTHDGNQCEAEVGGPVRWGRPHERTGEVRRFQEEGVVIEIKRTVTWTVVLDPATHRPPRHWNNPILCGDSAQVGFDDAPDRSE